MTCHKPLSKLPTNRVDWSNPHLESLLQKTEGWQLDNRGCYPAEDVEIHIGWGGGDTRRAMLVWERDQVMVIEAAFQIRHGEHVRVDRPFGDSYQAVWGVVVEGRPGNREQDLVNGIHVYWLKVHFSGQP
jgi:hypothetical protein